VHNPYLPREAEVIERIEETSTIFTLRLRFTDPEVNAQYTFTPGQFNMLYVYGIGEVPISIVSDPQDQHYYDHTIRVLGRVTKALAHLQVGDRLGVRGPFGRGWPLETFEGRDVVLITGGLGCAPLVSVINYIIARRERYGKLVIMQGVKHSADLIWRRKYEVWGTLPNTQVLLAADQTGLGWPWATGHITNLIDQAKFDASNSLSMLCGPEGLMVKTVEALLPRGVNEGDIWLSMERNMQCAVGHCGHCQYGPRFICNDGPVFCYEEIKDLLGQRGF